MRKNFGLGQSREAFSGKATSLLQSEARHALWKAGSFPNRPSGTRYRSTLDEAPEVHDLAEKNGISLRQARELLNGYQGDQAAIDAQITILKLAATALE
jgi:hypothetical protein